MNRGLAEVVGGDVPRETYERLYAYEMLLREESGSQNLVSRGTLDQLWTRHILDCAQLVRFAQDRASWVDVGSGAGLPGIVVACLVAGPVTLIEPRKLRAEFLHKAVAALGLDVTILCSKVQNVAGRFDVITARAVSPLGEFLKLSLHLSTGNSLWVLPKGRNAESEVAEARRTWQGRFQVERSRTDEDSGIVVATDVKAKRT